MNGQGGSERGSGIGIAAINEECPDAFRRPGYYEKNILITYLNTNIV